MGPFVSSLLVERRDSTTTKKHVHQTQFSKREITKLQATTCRRGRTGAGRSDAGRIEAGQRRKRRLGLQVKIRRRARRGAVAAVSAAVKMMVVVVMLLLLLLLLLGAIDSRLVVASASAGALSTVGTVTRVASSAFRSLAIATVASAAVRTARSASVIRVTASSSGPVAYDSIFRMLDLSCTD